MFLFTAYKNKSNYPLSFLELELFQKSNQLKMYSFIKRFYDHCLNHFKVQSRV